MDNLRGKTSTINLIMPTNWLFSKQIFYKAYGTERRSNY